MLQLVGDFFPVVQFEREEQQRRRILEAGKHAASADHLELMCRELLNVHGATTFYRVIDDLLLTFGTQGKGSHEHRALTANDLAAAEDPVSTLVAVAEEFSVELKLSFIGINGEELAND